MDYAQTADATPSFTALCASLNAHVEASLADAQELLHGEVAFAHQRSVEARLPEHRR